MRSHASRGGVTLLEMLIALIVIGLTVASGRAIADQIAGSGRATSGALNTQLAELSRSEALRSVGAAASAPRDSSDVFDGARDGFSLSTRCMDTFGIEGRCRCHLSIRTSSGGGSALARECSVGAVPDTLVADSIHLDLIYFVTADHGGRWTREWRNTNSLPIAVGVIRVGARDTVIVRIGERG